VVSTEMTLDFIWVMLKSDECYSTTLLLCKLYLR
jgi:hypothetical protein